MKDNLTVLKLGGSVITQKEKPLTPNLEAIKRLAREIKEANVKPLLVVHGGGSFGHWWAAKYRIRGGYRSQEQLMGFSKTHQAMMTLNKLVVDALVDAGVPAFPVQPSSFIMTKRGHITQIKAEIIQKLVELGLTPVLYGDAVVDSEMDFTILSGDQLISSLAIRFNAKRIIIGVDVDGLYTADPKTAPTAQLIEHITLEELKKRKHRIGRAKVTDVTGGMLGKITELIPAIERGIPIIIVNASKPNNIHKALKEEKIKGTTIRKT